MNKVIGKNQNFLAALLLVVISLSSTFVNTTEVRVSIVRRGKALRRVSSLCKDEGPGFAFHNRTNQCYKLGTDGPCEALMIFTVDTSEPDYGNCDCDYHRQCGRPILKYPADGECYYVYEQGPCADDEWLALKEDKTVICSKNICQAEGVKSPSNNTNYWFAENGKCYQTNTRGYCDDPNARLFFKSQDFKPTCNFGLLCGTAKRQGLDALIKLWNLHQQQQQANSNSNSSSSSPSNNEIQTYIAEIIDKNRMKEFVQRVRLVALERNASNKTSSE